MSIVDFPNGLYFQFIFVWYFVTAFPKLLISGIFFAIVEYAVFYCISLVYFGASFRAPIGNQTLGT